VTTLVDTSALFALLSEDDPAHDRAIEWIEHVSVNEDEVLLTHSYVVGEAIALTQARLGATAVRLLVNDLLPAVEVRFVDEDLHERAITALLAGLDRKVSFVDRTSFELMRAEDIRKAFTFDSDFADEGFETVP
jgi:predicted nucleic acid-binding protein